VKSRLGLPATGLVTGIIFGLGLSISQMTNPEKVLGFLDISDNWDPSLLFTMAAAIAVSSIGNRWILNKGPIFSEILHLPGKSDIDTRLVLGSLIFGTGWGLAGYCPGPAVTGLAGGLTDTVYFVIAMLVGSQLERLWLLRHPRTANSNDLD